MLDVTGRTVTFDEGPTTNVVVKISAAEGVRAKGVSVVDGDIVLEVKRPGLMVIVK